jgi:predicted Zn finger-like uncharacterized protein
MAQMTFHCPSCARAYQVDTSLSGKKIRCKGCNAISHIPAPPAPQPSAPESPGETIACPQCGHGFRVSADLAGRRARCKRCGEVFRIGAELCPEPLRAETARASSLSEVPHYSHSDAARNTPEPAGGDSLSVFQIVEDDDSGDVWESPPKARRPVTQEATAGDVRKAQAVPRSGRLPANIRVAGLIVVLILAGWALSGLFTRAWTAATDLFGTTSPNPNMPSLDADLDLPDVAPDRVPIIREHIKVLEELTQAYNGMASGYAWMRSPKWFRQGQDEVARASARLEEFGKKDSM